MTDVPPPCFHDALEYERDWTRTDVPIAEQRYMVGLCDDCPLRMACFEAVLQEGKHADGVWAGLMWRSGKSTNPRKDAVHPRCSVPGVHWEYRRGQWKAYTKRKRNGQTRFIHLGYFESEDEAIQAVSDFKAASDA